jgi:hypothetical protein
MRKWIFLFVIPTFVQAYSPTQESACTSLDLRDETLGEVRNQGQISWCFAFTASDMLSHTFHHERISAADVALNYNESLVGRIMSTVSPNGSPHETGLTKVALIKAMKDGWCPESVFPSEKWIRVSNGKEEEVPMPEAMKEIAGLHKIRKDLTEKNLPFWFKFKNVHPKNFISFLQTKNLRNFYQSLRLTACENDRHEFDSRWKTKMVLRNASVFPRINEQLNLGRMVGLDYDSRILASATHRGVKLSELHTSSIVGRRWNEEKRTCEYLIRNSYGSSCSSRYDRSYDCQNGQLWLNESQIYGSMTSVVYMLSAPRR